MASFEQASADAKRLERGAPARPPGGRLPEEEGRPVSYRAALDKPILFSEVLAEAKRLEKMIAAVQYGGGKKE